MSLLNKRPLISRVPSIWRRLDFQKTLEGFLEAEDNELLRLAELARNIPAMRNPDCVPDRRLKIAGVSKGHVWRSDKSFEWNRRKIETAITRHSYKGSYDRLGDELAEINADGYHVQDQASQIIVLSRQGSLSKSKIVDADFWHEGVFVIHVQDSRAPHVNPADIESLIDELRPAGQMWFTVRSFAKPVILEEIWTSVHGQMLWITDTMNEAIGYGSIDDCQDDLISPGYRAQVRVRKSFFPVEWRHDGDGHTGRTGHGIVGSGDSDGVIHGHSSGVRLRCSFIPVGWHTNGETSEADLDHGLLGTSIEVGFDGQRFYRPRLPKNGTASELLKEEIRRTFITAVRHTTGESAAGKPGAGDLGVSLWLSFQGTRFYNPDYDPKPGLFYLWLALSAFQARKTVHWVGHKLEMITGLLHSSVVPISGMAGLAVSRTLSEILSFDNSCDRSPSEEFWRISYAQNGSVLQGLLTTDSNLPANIDFPANTGHAQNYLTEEEASAQACLQISTYLFIDVGVELEGHLQRNQGGNI